jgi:inosine-uridine nucleoside N-ribohydrolase
LKKIIIDTDIGLGTRNAVIDDGLALSYAISKSKEIQIECITTVFGNVVGGEACKNAVNLLNILGKSDINVEKGATKPLKDREHGEPSADAAAKMIVSYAKNLPREITLVCIGPLTNLAAALIVEPNLPKNVKEVYIMGGAVTVPGNVTPTAEFNVYSDPIAAKIVFNSGMPIILVPLDVTTKTLITQRHLETLRSKGGKILNYICDWVEPWLKFQEQTLKLGGANLHDPLTVAIAIDNSLAQMRQMSVDVETKGEITKGMTVSERRFFISPRVKNMNVCLDINEPRFMEEFIGSLMILGQK